MERFTKLPKSTKNVGGYVLSKTSEIVYIIHFTYTNITM